MQDREKQLRSELEAARKRLYERLHNGEDPQKAYEEEAWPALLALWREYPQVKGGVARGFDLSVHTLGTSPEATILAILGTRAREVHILHTADTKQHLEKIQKDAGVLVYPRQIDKSNVTTVYQAVEEILPSSREVRVAMDLTSGTKAMTSGLAAAAFFLQRVYSGIQVVYVDSEEFDTTLRRPVPGKEVLIRLPNPYEVLGNFQKLIGGELYQRGEFKSAEEVFREAHRNTGKGEFDLLARLSRAYWSWQVFRFAEAAGALKSLIGELEKDAWISHPLGRSLDTLRGQREGLEAMARLVEQKDLSQKEAVAWLASTLLKRSEETDHLAMAALYAYRALELLLQHLALEAGQNPESPSLGPEEDQAFERTLEELLGEKPRRWERWGLLEILAYLKSKDHPALKGWDLKRLQGVKGALQTRNKLLLVHGLEVPQERSIRQIRGLAYDLVRWLGHRVDVEPVNIS